MDESISHSGTVVLSDGRQLIVDITPDAHDCGGCAVASLCNARSGNRLTLNVPDASARFCPGQKVTLRASGRSRMKAIALLLALPTALVIAVAAIAAAAGLGETVMAVGSLAVAAVYFVLLYISNRHSSLSSINWTVE